MQKDIKNGALKEMYTIHKLEQRFHILNAIMYVKNLDPYSLRLVGLTAGRQSDEILGDLNFVQIALLEFSLGLTNVHCCYNVANTFQLVFWVRFIVRRFGGN